MHLSPFANKFLILNLQVISKFPGCTPPIQASNLTEESQISDPIKTVKAAFVEVCTTCSCCCPFIKLHRRKFCPEVEFTVVSSVCYSRETNWFELACFEAHETPESKARGVAAFWAECREVWLKVQISMQICPWGNYWMVLCLQAHMQNENNNNSILHFFKFKLLLVNVRMVVLELQGKNTEFSKTFPLKFVSLKVKGTT